MEADFVLEAANVLRLLFAFSLEDGDLLFELSLFESVVRVQMLVEAGEISIRRPWGRLLR